MQGAVEQAQALHAELEGSILAGQFDNPANPAAHYQTTGPEIWQDTDGQVDAFVAGIGTGGTISGAGKYLKEQNPNLIFWQLSRQIRLCSQRGKRDRIRFRGLVANFVPQTLDRGIYDEILQHNLTRLLLLPVKSPEKKGCWWGFLEVQQ